MALTSAGADATRIYDELLVTTAEHIHPGIVENAIDNSPATSIFLGKIGAALNGAIGEDNAPAAAGAEAVTGESIRVNVKLGKNDSFRWLSSGFGEISLDTSDTARGSRANFKLGAGSVVIDGSTLRKNSGAAQIASILRHKQDDTVSSMVDYVGDAMLASSASPNAITSLLEIISANDEIQSLNGSTFTNWNSRGISDKGTAPGSISFASGSFASRGISDFRAAFMNAEEGSIKPNVILTTDSIFRFYEGSLTPQVRFESLNVGDMSFNQLRFKDAPIFHDPKVPSGTALFLNTDFIGMKHLPGALFDISPMERGNNQDAFVAPVLFEGQLCCSARKYQNKLTGITA